MSLAVILNRSGPRNLVFALAGLLLLTGGKASGQELPAELAAVPADAPSFFHVRLGDLIYGSIGSQVQKIYPNEFGRMEMELKEFTNEGGLESISFMVYSTQSMFGGRRYRRFDDKKKVEKKTTDKEDADSLEYLGIFTAVKGVDQAKVLRTFLGQENVQKEFNGKVYFVSKQDYRESSVHFISERTFALATPPEGIKKILAKPAEQKQPHPLASALQLAKLKYPLVAGLNFTSPKVQEERKQLLAMWKSAHGKLGSRLFPALPPGLMNLLDMQSAVASVAIVNNNIRVQGSAQFASPEKAAEAADAVQDALLLLRIFTSSRMDHTLRSEAKNSDELLDLLFWALVARHADAALREPLIERRQSTVHLQMECQVDMPALRKKAEAEVKVVENDPVYQQARLRRQSARNLSQIARGLQAFSNAHKYLPPAAICSKKDGSALLSWRVAILPYIGEEVLYKEFKLDESWDSPHNMKLLPRMPKTYQPVGLVVAPPFTTYYQAFIGPGTALEYKLDAKEFLGARGIRAHSWESRGDDDQIVAAEAFDPVPWTKPAELVFYPDKPQPNFGGQFEDGFHVVYLNYGRTRFFTTQADLRDVIRRPKKKDEEKKGK